MLANTAPACKVGSPQRLSQALAHPHDTQQPLLPQAMQSHTWQLANATAAFCYMLLSDEDGSTAFKPPSRTQHARCPCSSPSPSHGQLVASLHRAAEPPAVAAAASQRRWLPVCGKCFALLVCAVTKCSCAPADARACAQLKATAECGRGFVWCDA